MTICVCNIFICRTNYWKFIIDWNCSVSYSIWLHYWRNTMLIECTGTWKQYRYWRKYSLDMEENMRADFISLDSYVDWTVSNYLKINNISILYNLLVSNTRLNINVYVINVIRNIDFSLCWTWYHRYIDWTW